MIQFPWTRKEDWILGGFEYLHADNVIADPGAGGATFRTDDVGSGVQVPFAKLMDGTDGSSAIIPGDATNGLFVNVKAAALPTGAATEATLAAASAKLPATLGQKAMAASMAVALASDQSALAVTGTFFQATQPVSAAALPLPSGAATETTLAALNTKTATAKTSDYDTGAGTDTVPMVGIALPASGGAVQGGTATNPVRTDPTGTTAQPITDNSGSLTVDSGQLPATLGQKAMAASMAVVLASDQASIPITVASIPSHAVTNAGTFVVQENGAALTALQLIDNLVLAEDSVAGSADPGVGVFAVRRDTPSAAAADGDYVNLSVNSTGALYVTGGGGGTQYQEDTAHVSGDTGTLSLAVRRDANTTLVDTTGDYAPLQVDANGNLKVNIIAGAGSGGTAMADDAAFTPATTSITPVGGTYRSTLDAVDDGDAGAFAMTQNRAVHVNLRDASGNELVTGAQYAEDAVHASGDFVTMAGVVRKDTATQLAGTDGDNSVLVNDASGRLHVNVGALPAIPTGSNVIGALTANQSVNVAQINGVTPLMGNGASGTGAQRVTIANDSTGQVAITGTVTVASHAVTNAGTFVVQAGTVAHDGAVSGNPVRIAGRASTTDYTAVADGDTADALTTITGKLVTMPFSIPQNEWNYAGAAGGLVTTSGVTVKAAAASGIRNYVTYIQIINSHQTIGTEVVLRDGAAGTVLGRWWAQAAGGGFAGPVKLKSSTATLLEIAEVTTTATAGVVVSIQGYTAAE